jgi:peroxiredoxin
MNGPLVDTAIAAPREHPAQAVRGQARLAARIVGVAVAMAVAAECAHALPLQGTAVQAEQAAAVLGRHTLRNMDGSTLSLTSLRGEVVVLNFWASWCAPCRRELPRLQLLNEELKHLGGRVLAVSIDADRRNVELFALRQELHLPILLDGPDGLARELDLRSVPVTIVLDRDGHVAFASTRSDAAGLDALVAATRKLAGAPPVAAREAAGGPR